MRSSNQTGRTKTSSKSQGIPNLLTLIGAAIMVVALIIMCIFSASAYAGNDDSNPVVVFYNYEGDFPKTSMSNSLHGAGFNYILEDSSIDFDDDNRYVIAATGHDAITVINEYKEVPEVLGFVLINPLISEGQSLDGISSSYPSKDIAIFSGSDNASSVSDICDSRIIYERLSGDDTVYGVAIKRGGLFSSDCYINNNQNRYLSLSAFRYDDGKSMLYSPLFQNELAGYLGVTYQSETSGNISFPRINSWFLMMAVSVFAFIFGGALYLATLPIVSDKKKSKYSKATLIVSGVFSAVISIMLIVLSFIPDITGLVSLFIKVMPLLMMFVLVLVGLKNLFGISSKTFNSKSKLLRPLFISGSLVLFTTLVLFAFGDLTCGYNFPIVAIAAICLVADSLMELALSVMDRNSVSKGEGHNLYFGNPLFLCMLLLPSVAALLTGLVFGIGVYKTFGLGCILLSVIPYLGVSVLRRHSDNLFIESLLHGILYMVVFLAIA